MSSTDSGRPTDVLTRILAWAESDPSHPAAKDDAGELDYAGLRDRVAAVATGLSAHGVAADDRVALDIPNSVDFLVGALACLWVGAMFVPLAVTDPPARVASVVADCAPVLVLTGGGRQEPFPGAVAIDAVEADGAAALQRTGAPATPPVPADDRPAYAIYTSGTTGTPKGVVIGRQAFAAAVECTATLLGMSPDTRALCVSPFHFDGSFGTLFPAVAAGGRLMIPPRDSLLFARFFFRIVAREQITHTGFSSSYLSLLLSGGPLLNTLAETPLRVIALGGEVCSGPDVARLWAVKPDIRVFNRYGPTETTIAVTHFKVTPEVIATGGPVPIGMPHPGVGFHLIDQQGDAAVAPGEVGELFISGAQLMAGYWGAPELTDEVLRTDVVPGQLVYRTGDLIRQQADGNYVYVDRTNRVIKRNAVRISLVELTDVMRSLPEVSAAACSTFDNDGQLGIAAFVVVAEDVTAEMTRRAAAQRLPANMMPDSIQLVDSLPLTSSSKVDERKLLADAGLLPLQ